MGIFDRLFGRPKQTEPLRELVFKSPMDAYEHEFEFGAVNSPTAEDRLTGLVLHAYQGKDNVQYAAVVIVSHHQIARSPDRLEEIVPGFNDLPERLKNIAVNQGTVTPSTPCADKIPKLSPGDLVMVWIGEVMPGDSLFCTMGVVVAAMEPVLNLENGWKMRIA